MLIMRFPADVKAALRRAADDEHRSMSGLVLNLVSEYLASEGYLDAKNRAPRRARKG